MVHSYGDLRTPSARAEGVRIPAAEQRPLASRWQAWVYSPKAKFPYIYNTPHGVFFFYFSGRRGRRPLQASGKAQDTQRLCRTNFRTIAIHRPVFCFLILNGDDALAQRPPLYGNAPRGKAHFLFQTPVWHGLCRVLSALHDPFP